MQPAKSAPAIRAFFDEPTNTISYLVWDLATRAAVVIDPVLDWNNRSGEADTRSANEILRVAEAEEVTIGWILETHAHADHLTAAPYIKAKTGAPIGIGEHIRDVQRLFRPVFNALDLKPDGSDFDRLLKDGEHLALGRLTIEVLHVPGHTPADVAYRIGQDVFVGDTLFMPDYGTARADFPGGDAVLLYQSIRRLLDLPPETKLRICHDYKAPGRDHYAWQTTVAERRANNTQVRDGITQQAFIDFRKARDATLAAPLLLLPSIQVNIRAGRFPDAEDNGVRYLKIPVRPKGGAVETTK